MHVSMRAVDVGTSRYGGMKVLEARYKRVDVEVQRYCKRRPAQRGPKW